MAKYVPQEELSLVDQVRIRREKLAQLRAGGKDPFTHMKFDFDTTSAIIKEHFELMLKTYSEHAVGIFRKHLHEYSKGLSGASEFRSSINQIHSPDDMRAEIERFFDPCKAIY